MTGAYDHVISALRDCVFVMERDLYGLQLIQPELAKGKKALADLEAVNAEPAQWNGEGLPPVGTVCEWRGPNSDGPDGWVWAEAEVCGYTADGLFVFMQQPSCWPVVQRIDNCGFRPIRTPEQIAAEARAKAIAEMVEAIGHFGNLPAASLFATCARLHDAGYQKTTE